MCWRLLGLGLAGLLAVSPAGAAMVDAVLAEVDGQVVAASDIALARALRLFGFSPSNDSIEIRDVERFVDARLILDEASRLGIAASPADVDAAWDAARRRLGGEAALTAWLREVGVEPEWARRLVAADWAWEQFVDLRFRAFVFVTEREVDEALGRGTHSEEARARERARLREAAVARSLGEWLADARGRFSVRHVESREPAFTLPFPMPAGGTSPARRAP